jgi:hypothetical protein
MAFVRLLQVSLFFGSLLSKYSPNLTLTEIKIFITCSSCLGKKRPDQQVLFHFERNKQKLTFILRCFPSGIQQVIFSSEILITIQI